MLKRIKFKWFFPRGISRKRFKRELQAYRKDKGLWTKTIDQVVACTQEWVEKNN